MGRTKLSEKYHEEREEICKKLLEIVGTEFYLYDLDNDPEKQAAILALKDEIQNCFAVSSMSTFKPSLTDVKKDYLNIVRTILRQQGYSVIGRGTSLRTGEEIKRTQKYTIFRQ
jgi:hypothetical protein